MADNDGPAIITDHPFESRGEWWDLCKICSLAQAAHAETTVLPPVVKSVEPATVLPPHAHYYSDDNPEED